MKNESERRLKNAIEYVTAQWGNGWYQRKHPVRTAGGSGQAASLTALGFQFQGRSCLRSWMV